MSVSHIGVHVFYLDVGGFWGYNFIICLFKCEKKAQSLKSTRWI